MTDEQRQLLLDAVKVVLDCLKPGEAMTILMDECSNLADLKAVNLTVFVEDEDGEEDAI